MTNSRREFLKVIGAGAVASPFFVHASDKTGEKPVKIGSGEHQYLCHHGWGTLPEGVRWGETHGVAIDAEGLVYIKHRNREKDPIDAIVVFDQSGKAVRSFGKEYHLGGHGIDIRKEGDEEFLYLCDVEHRTVTKTNLKGDHVWQMSFPKEAGVYTDVKQFNPTNVAFHPEGGFYVADGYGSNYIHQYDKDAKYIRTFGGTGTEDGKMKTPHGLWLDDRPGRDTMLIVADRANARLQYFTLDGKFVEVVGNVSFPAHFDIKGSELLVPDLHARVSLFNEKNEVIVHLGHDPEWTKEVLVEFKMRQEPNRWVNGKFIHPHDACFDAEGNIYVVEWVPIGRVTFLERV